MTEQILADAAQFGIKITTARKGSKRYHRWIALVLRTRFLVDRDDLDGALAALWDANEIA